MPTRELVPGHVDQARQAATVSQGTALRLPEARRGDVLEWQGATHANTHATPGSLR
jgi:hypothetical protein